MPSSYPYGSMKSTEFYDNAKEVNAMGLTKVIFLSFILFLFPSPSSSFPSPSSTPGDLRISFLSGDVQVRTGDTSEWIPASINMPLLDGDSVWVPEGGRAALQMRDGTYVRLEEKSSMDILTLEGDSSQFYLSLGHAYVNFRGLPKTFLQMDTPVSSVRAYEESVFRIDVFDNGDSDISVFKGALYAEGRSGKTRISAGDMLSLRDTAYASLSPLASPDDWERWNREMDRKVERRQSVRYLPDDLNAYSYELDEYGKWVYVRDYGYCWTPTAVSAGWAPYRIGRWTWIGGDYVWVSYEPWGWTPYHYGRWAHVASYGWCWVPPARGAVYWSPGYVGWVQTPTYVSWVPLAPGEIYYGYGYYGPHSVNLINVNINTVNVTNVYRNVYVNNAVTVVSHDAFIRGRAMDARTKENPFLTQRISAGRPQITPVRETRMPVIKDIPEAKQPPRAIRQIEVRRLKENRPVVKDPARSVFRPGTTPGQMSVTTIKEPRQPRTTVQPKGTQPRTTDRKLRAPDSQTSGKTLERPTTEAGGKGSQKSRIGSAETQKSGNDAKSKEVQRPANAPVNREVQRAGGTTTGGSVQTAPGQASGREIKGRSSEATSKETGKQAVPKQKRGPEAEQEQARERNMIK